MKKFMQRVQDLNQKATQIREAIKQAPAQVAQVREAVTASAAQLQQMRMNVQSSVNDLKVTDDQQLVDALTEIDGGRDFFRQAGFSVEGIDVEVGVMSKLVVHLRKAERVPPGMVRSLISGHLSEKKTCGAILTAILRAEELESKIRLGNFEYSEAVVDMGMMPTVRLCWWPTDSVAIAPATPPPLPPVIQTTPIPMSPAPPAPAPKPVPAAATTPPAPAAAPSPYGQSSYFGTSTPYTPTPTPAPAPAPPTAPAPAPAPAPASSGYSYTPTPTTEAPKKTSWGRESLDRFKKMPDLGR